jgi:hypothetical protein
LGTSTKWSGDGSATNNIIEGYDFSDIPFGSAQTLLSTKLKNFGDSQVLPI